MCQLQRLATVEVGNPINAPSHEVSGLVLKTIGVDTIIQTPSIDLAKFFSNYSPPR